MIKSYNVELGMALTTYKTPRIGMFLFLLLVCHAGASRSTLNHAARIIPEKEASLSQYFI
jgi:hypothetical protein